MRHHINLEEYLVGQSFDTCAYEAVVSKSKRDADNKVNAIQIAWAFKGIEGIFTGWYTRCRDGDGCIFSEGGIIYPQNPDFQFYNDLLKVRELVGMTIECPTIFIDGVKEQNDNRKSMQNL